MSYPSSQILLSNWENLESRIPKNIATILSFLEHYGQHATFYILGWVAERFPETIDAIHKAGHEIGYHSYYHQLPSRQSHQLFEKDLEKGLAVLENITKNKITLYRAPNFSFDFTTGWAIPILLNYGIKASSSVLSGLKSAPLAIPQTPFYFEYREHRILELPLNRLHFAEGYWVYTGSGFFRILPLWLLKSLYSRRSYNMAYFHPRDFDPKVPSTTLLPFYRNIMSRLGNKTTIPKLSVLFADFRFTTVGEAIPELNIENLPVIRLS